MRMRPRGKASRGAKVTVASRLQLPLPPLAPCHVQFSVKMRLASLNSGVENDSLRGRKW